MAGAVDIHAKYIPSAAGALRQGEVVTDLALYICSSPGVDSNSSEFTKIVIPVAVVVSQDCDLHWDYEARSSTPPADGKLLHSILFCQAEDAAAAKLHAPPNVWKRIIQNKDERYQFLQTISADHDAQGTGIGELVLDFKRYFSLFATDAYDQVAGTAMRRCRLDSPYLQQLTTRFYYFQYRVALPSDHESEPGK